VLELQATILALGKEVARKQSMIARLRAGQAEEHPPQYEDAMEVARYWKETLCPGAKELNGQRLRNTIHRLQAGYEVDQLKQALDGYYARPNVKDGKRVRSSEGGTRRTDLELLMRDEKHVMDGIAIAVEEMAHDQGVLNGGGSRYVALLCGCGHPLVSHQLYYLTGGTACAEKDCTCLEFDSLPTESEQWLHQQGYYERRRAEEQRIARSTPKGQERLL
jgi:hypothetical protein